MGRERTPSLHPPGPVLGRNNPTPHTSPGMCGMDRDPSCPPYWVPWGTCEAQRWRPIVRAIMKPLAGRLKVRAGRCRGDAKRPPKQDLLRVPSRRGNTPPFILHRPGRNTATPQQSIVPEMRGMYGESLGPPPWVPSAMGETHRRRSLNLRRHADLYERTRERIVALAYRDFATRCFRCASGD
jgi:hypothetical protein